MSEHRPNLLRSLRLDGGIALAIMLGVVLLYARAVGFDFIDFDDNLYVYDNPIVREGLTLAGVKWAFTTGHSANWHPLTWLSHMLDVSLFGTRPGGHHAMNALIHAVNGVVLFVLLRLATGRVWLAGFAAALFAWHPLRVESVAWISERKDTLSTLFWLATMLFYLGYVRLDRQRARWYVAACVSLALGLMSKGMLVTLPFVLLLFDFWPLRRSESWRRLVGEKLPMFALVAVMSYVTLRVQASGGAVTAVAAMGPMERVANAAASYFDYLRLTFVPTGLAIFYPNPYFAGGAGIPIWKLILAPAVLIAVSGLAVWQMRRRPYLAVGWFWFLGTLVPVIGLVQIGSQGMADRYTYVPSIGLAVLLVWLVAERSRAVPSRGVVVGVIACLAYAAATFHQVGFWRDTETVMQRAADAVPDNYLAHINLGTIHDARGDDLQAERHYREAIRIVPIDPISNNNLGGFLVAAGRPAEALPFLEKAVALDPAYAAARISLGDYYDAVDEAARAVEQYERAIAIEPTRKEAYHHLALAQARRGMINEAIAHWRQALEIDPDYAAALDGCGRAMLLRGETAEGHRLLRLAIERRPDWDSTAYVLAWSLATDPEVGERRPREAVDLARRALALRPSNPLYADVLGAALASAGEFDEAVVVTTRAAAAARRAGATSTADAMDARAALYRDRRAYVRPAN